MRFAFARVLAVLACCVAPWSAKAADQAILTFSFDDSLLSQYRLGFPVLKSRSIPATACVLASPEMSDTPGPRALETKWSLMAWSQVKELLAAGWEVCAHSVTHPNLTQVSERQLFAEIVRPKSIIQQKVGVAPTVFASPGGAFNERTLDVIRALYRAQLGVWWPGLEIAGFNGMKSLDPYRVTRLGVTRDEPTPERVCKYIDEAIARGVWYVLEFHNILEHPNQAQDDENAVSVSALETIAQCAVAARDAGRLRILTAGEALDAIAPHHGAPTR